MAVKPVLAILLVSLLAATPTPTRSDDTQPLYLSVTERENGLFDWQARLPPQVPQFKAPRLVLPHFCVVVGQDDLVLSSNHVQTRCHRDPGGIRVSLEFPVTITPTPLIVRTTYQDGQSHTVLVGAGQYAWQFPRRETASGVAMEYAQLGIHHIWVGADHLLFLLCLMWVAGTFRRIVITVTGFTLAHSLTLILSALQIVKLPIPPVESVIALSVVFLAREVVNGPSHTVTWRQPVAVSSSFGLLHGLGFAAVLQEIGLPQTELVTALVSFNVGVEIGQLCFVSLVAIGLWYIKRLFILGPQIDVVRLATGYSIGTLAMFWMIDRTTWLF